MRLLFLDSDNRETSLYINPEFTTETVKRMLCQKIQADEEDVILLIKRSEVSFSKAVRIFDGPSLQSYCDYIALVDDVRIKSLPDLQDICIRAVKVTPLEISIDCMFKNGTKPVRVNIDRYAPVGQLVNQIAASLSSRVHKRYLQLSFCDRNLADDSLPLYKYGIVFSTIINGKLVELPHQRRIVIHDIDHVPCIVYVPETITVARLVEKVQEATKDDAFILIWNGNELSNPRLVITVRDGDRFMKIKPGNQLAAAQDGTNRSILAAAGHRLRSSLKK